MSRSAEFNSAAAAARPESDTPQVRAYDRDTGAVLSHEDAMAAEDNPEIYKWVDWR